MYLSLPLQEKLRDVGHVMDSGTQITQFVCQDVVYVVVLAMFEFDASILPIHQEM